MIKHISIGDRDVEYHGNLAATVMYQAKSYESDFIHYDEDGNIVSVSSDYDDGDGFHIAVGDRVVIDKSGMSHEVLDIYSGLAKYHIEFGNPQWSD